MRLAAEIPDPLAAMGPTSKGIVHRVYSHDDTAVWPQIHRKKTTFENP